MQGQTTTEDTRRLRKGILLSLFAIFVFATQDTATKLLVADHSPFQITMMRYWAFAAFSLFLVTRRAPLRQAFRSARPRLRAKWTTPRRTSPRTERAVPAPFANSGK